jgi:hypothetical protein
LPLTKGNFKNKIQRFLSSNQKEALTMEKVKETEIRITEVYGDKCFVDKFQDGGGGKRRPEGIVEIWEEDENGNKRLVRKNNLVVYLGRETLAQILVNKNNVDELGNQRIVSTKDHFLSWFGLGDGGVLPADPFDPVPPANENTDLQSRVMCNATDSSAADYHIVSSGYPKPGYYKLPFDTIGFERDNLNDNKWLVLKITISVGIDDANNERLSEAGLFTSVSNAGGYTPVAPAAFALFARVSFPTIIKDATRRLIFVWYLYV